MILCKIFGHKWEVSKTTLTAGPNKGAEFYKLYCRRCNEHPTSEQIDELYKELKG